MKYFLIFLFLFLKINSVSQELKFKVIDTLYFKDLTVNNIIYEKCPGYLSGLPCYKSINFIDFRNPKKKLLVSKGTNLYYHFFDNETLLFNLKDDFDNFFFNLKKDTIDVNRFDVLPITKKRKYCNNSLIYKNLKVYKILIKKDIINSIIRNNIKIKSNEIYLIIYIIYNSK